MDWYYNLSLLSKGKDHDCHVMNCEGIEVAVPVSNQGLLAGIHIDYSEDLMGGGFRFSNPNAAQTCGCGSSFSTNAMTEDCDTMHSCM